MLFPVAMKHLKFIVFIGFLAQFLWADLKTYQIPRNNFGNYQGSSPITFYYDKLVEKIGISERQNSDNDSRNCTPEFRQRNTLNQRLLDSLTVIEFLRKSDRQWNRKLLIIGGSEGGMLAPIFAGLVPETHKIVMLVIGNGRLMVDDTKEAIANSI